MPEKNPLTNKRSPKTKPIVQPSDSGGGLDLPAPTSLCNFNDTIELPFTIPIHDPNSLIPGDVYDPNTSSAPRMKRDDADERIQAYSEMIAAQEVAETGYHFISAIFKTHTAYQRAMGDGFSALRETLSTQRKQVAAATAVVDLDTEN
ncbi:hypothetical protein HC928_04385 [bacterium]|nr:hypothetical protein [bacterium]